MADRSTAESRGGLLSVVCGHIKALKCALL